MARAHIELLGRFSVVLDGAAVQAWPSRRAADVVKLLALAPRHRLLRAELMESLWPDSDPRASGANLRKAVHFARTATGDPDTIVNDHGILALWPAVEVSVDVERFSAAASEAIRSGDVNRCRAAAADYPGDLLPEDRYEDWSTEPREHLRSLYLDLLRAGAQWQLVADADPTDEHAVRVLMRDRLDAGERREAIRLFERLRVVLRDRLGIGPDAATVALLEEALASDDEPPDPRDRAHALLARALMHVSRGELEAGERAADQARTIALDAGLGRELGEAATILANTAMMQGVWQQRFADELTESMRRQTQMPAIIYDAHLCVAEFYLAGPGGRDAAAAFAREMIVTAQEVGSETGAALALLMLGEAELLSGDVDDAQVQLRRAAEANEALGCLSGAALAQQRLAEAALTQGRVSTARKLLTNARSLSERSAIVSHLLVRVFDTMIRAAPSGEQAMAVLDEAERDLAQTPSCEPCSMGYLTTAATACARAARPTRARRFLAEAERIAGMWQGGPWVGELWETRGHLRLAENEEAQAHAMFREAAQAFTEAGRPDAAARCAAAG